LTDEVFRLECDTVVLAVGERVDMDFARASGLQIKESGTIEVDRQTLETSRSRFYAGGDVITGAANVSNAMGYGKKAARNIDQRLMGEHRLPRVMPDFPYGQSPPEHPNPARRHHAAEVPAAERVRGFGEVVVGLSLEHALEEARRCLRCDVHENGHDTSMERMEQHAAQGLHAN
jgi:NADPH-dependent glutamate synthase beta subunit-like oxidoreductase